MDNIFWIEGNSRKEWLMDRQKGQRRIEMSKLEGCEKVVRQAVVIAISEKEKFQVIFRSRVKLWHRKTEIE